MKIGVKLSKLTITQVDELYEEFFTKLLKQKENLDQSVKKEMLLNIMTYFEVCDEDDVFGTEGWKHYFGLDG